MLGVTAFRIAFNERALVPSELFTWNEYEARLFRYALAEAFYTNTAYRDIQSFAPTLKYQYALSKQIRGVYNPVFRQNEVIKGKLYGGAMDWDKLQTGAVQIDGADETLLEALIQALKWSNWGTNKSLYAHTGALLGDAPLKVVDNRNRGKVRLEVVHPAKIKDTTVDDVGNVKSYVIEYEREWVHPDTKRREWVTYTETNDGEEVVTLKDGEEYGWQLDLNGNPISRWPNEYGFVPLVMGGFADLGRQYAANAFHASMSKIHELNDVASLLSDSIRKNVDPPWLLAGVEKPSTTPKIPGKLSDGTATIDPTAQRDQQKVFYGSDSARPHAMVMPVDIGGAMEHINGLLMELERDMPELALHRLREQGGDISGVAIRNMYSDATGRLSEAAGNLDDALIRALQMAVSIGGYRGYENLNGYDLGSYARGDLDFSIKPRQFFEDGFSPQQKITNLQALPDNPEAARLILDEMGYSEEQIMKVLAGMQAKAQQQPVNPDGTPITISDNPRAQLPSGQPETPPEEDILAFVDQVMQGVAA